MPVDQLSSIRDRFLPMLAYGQNEYGYRVPAGYPIIHDDVERGVIGFELDPMHSIHVTTDGEQIYADVFYRSQRYDVRSSASREKFAGRGVVDRRWLGPHPTDQQLRNLIAELMSRFNQQQTMIYFTDD
ncbi:MAG TPA: hypothetical protein VFI12_11185 [Thermomicrobiales bacterium]|nr:hypothetical protein [Thermomicrobiales bacterium]